jgi:transglutaminase-like putative cysteine protease
MEDHPPRQGDHRRDGRPLLEGAFVNRAAGWVLGRVDGRELLKFALLAALLAAVASAVVPLIFRSDALLLFSAVLIGLCAGWVTGRIPLPAWAAGGLDAVLGLNFFSFTIGRLDVPLGRWIVSAAGFAARLSGWEWGNGLDLGAWLEDTRRLLEGPMYLAARIRDWVLPFLRGEVLFDPAAAAFFWGFLFFWVGSFAGWAASRGGKPFASVLPAVFLYGIVSAGGRGDWQNAVWIVALVLFFVVSVEYGQKEREWERKRIGSSAGLWVDLFFSAAPAAAVLVAVSFLITSIPVEDISRWIREQGQVSGQSGADNRAHDAGTGPSSLSSFPYTHPLGAGPDLTHNVALEIVTGETYFFLPGIREPVAPRHYWKSMTYDLYSGSGWLTSPIEEREIPPNEPVRAVPVGGTILHQTVAVNRSGGGPLYAAGELAKVYQRFQIFWRTDQDVLGAVVSGPLYEVDSIILEADESALRAAGTEYPEWIRNRYLQLPNGLPQRVLILARDLTAALPTPYDRALAIQDYLRREMRYNLEVGAPPIGSDAVDYFLFDRQEGFCDYFASAMAVLARAAGIPARLAVGYASGTFDTTRGKYTVLDSDAHAWPELFFPGIGWMEFEPTSSMPSIRRAAETSSPVPDQGPPDSSGGPLPAVWNGLKKMIADSASPAAFLLLALPALFLAWVLSAPLRLRTAASDRLARLVYRGLARQGRREGIRIFPETTPMNLVRRLAQRHPRQLDPLARVGAWYSRQVYGGKISDRRQRIEVIRTWTRLERALWFEWLRGRIFGGS